MQKAYGIGGISQSNSRQNLEAQKSSRSSGLNSKRLAPIRATDLRGKKDLSTLGVKTTKTPLMKKFDE